MLRRTITALLAAVIISAGALSARAFRPEIPRVRAKPALVACCALRTAHEAAARDEARAPGQPGHPSILLVVARVHDALGFVATTTTTAQPQPRYQPRAAARASSPALLAAGAPRPISSARCADRGRADIGALIERIFGSAGPWAESVAVRESGCTPGIVNSRGCLGLFQFCGHEDIFAAICGPAWHLPDADCEVRAAYHLYVGSGTGPWSL